MLQATHRLCWRNLPRKLCSCLTLVTYLVAALGVPMPVSARPKDHSPFPCQNHPCGCVTAEQCWRACCCFTAQQRWEWARANNVEPPPYAEKPTAQSWRTARVRDKEEGKAEAVPGNCSCCSPSAEPTRKACCRETPGSKKASSAKTTCCSQDHHDKDCPDSSPGNSEQNCHPGTSTGTNWRLGLAAQKCQGQTTLWAAAGTVLPAHQPLPWRPDLAAAGWLANPGSAGPVIPIAPPDPPPRLTAVCA
jgi:hypothetical protein